MYKGLLVTFWKIKLRAMKQDPEVWNGEVFCNVSTKKLVDFSQLGLWEAKERERPLCMEEREVRRMVAEDFKKWAALEKFFGDKNLETLAKRGIRTLIFYKVVMKNFFIQVKSEWDCYNCRGRYQRRCGNAFRLTVFETGDCRPSINKLDFASSSSLGS